MKHTTEQPIDTRTSTGALIAAALSDYAVAAIAHNNRLRTHDRRDSAACLLWDMVTDATLDVTIRARAARLVTEASACCDECGDLGYTFDDGDFVACTACPDRRDRDGDEAWRALAIVEGRANESSAFADTARDLLNNA